MGGIMRLFMKTIIYVLAGIATMAWVGAAAQLVPQLNWGQVLVAKRDASTINQAYALAMRQVLAKYSGQSELANTDAVNNFISNASQLVLRYSFSSHASTPGHTLAVKYRVCATADRAIFTKLRYEFMEC